MNECEFLTATYILPLRVMAICLGWHEGNTLSEDDIDWYELRVFMLRRQYQECTPRMKWYYYSQAIALVSAATGPLD